MDESVYIPRAVFARFIDEQFVLAFKAYRYGGLTRRDAERASRYGLIKQHMDLATGDRFRFILTSAGYKALELPEEPTDMSICGVLTIMIEHRLASYDAFAHLDVRDLQILNGEARPPIPATRIVDRGRNFLQLRKAGKLP